jgi:hypothetical protein
MSDRPHAGLEKENVLVTESTERMRPSGRHANLADEERINPWRTEVPTQVNTVTQGGL